ncbi:MAG: hypothetical protein N2166_00240 [candidate division WOR-3 bacterium]|nr:hypothetical protein [candidate division WOR-3 bacterium]
MGNKIFYLSLFTVLFLVFIGSCEKNSVGYEELERQISQPEYLEARTTLTGRWSYRKYIPLGKSSVLVLGRNLAYESRLLFDFSFSDTIAVESVISAQLILYTKLAFPVAFKVYPIKSSSPWKETYTTWTRMDDNVPWDSAGGDFYLTLLAQGTVNAESTVINLNLSKLDTIINHSRGLIVIPDTQSNGFAAIYAKEFGSKQAKLLLQFTRTKKTYLINQDAHIIYTTQELGAQDYLIGCGVPYRTLLKFDLTSLPREPVTITLAELYLPIDEEFSIFDTLKIVAKKITDSMPFSELTKFDNSAQASADYSLRQDSVLILDLQSLVQFWSINPDSNFGLILCTEPENYGLGRLKINPHAPGIRLKIGYIKAPQGRF